MAKPAKLPVAAYRSVPLTERRYLVPLTLVTSLFFLWALGVNLNDILIPHLKKAFRLTDLQSSLQNRPGCQVIRRGPVVGHAGVVVLDQGGEV